MSYSPPDLDLAAYVERQVAAGFHSALAIHRRAMLVHQVPPERAEWVRDLIDRALAAHERARAAWPATTDCDRLDAAFVALDEAGVLARHDYSCCTKCGHREIADLLHDARERGRSAGGYVFYHWQDTDRAAGGGTLHLRYGAAEDAAEASAAIGRRVVEALRARGLAPVWSGDPSETIELRSFDWKRRSPPPDPVPLFTPRGCRDAWCALLPRAVVSDFARTLGERYAAVAIELGRADVALAWARAPLPALQRGLTRWRAASCVAAALLPSGRTSLASELLCDAYASGVHRAGGGLVDLLAGGHLDDPAVREAARAQVASSRRDVFRAAATAWLLVRSRPGAEDGGDVQALCRVLGGPRPDLHSDEDFARTALAAALWVLLVRRGDVEGARRARAVVLESAERLPAAGFGEHALRASIAAAGEVGELDALGPSLLELGDRCRGAIADEHARAGAIDGAIRACGAAALATVVRFARDEPRAGRWAADFEAWLAAQEELLEEGLADEREVHDARLDLVSMCAALGRHDRAAEALATTLAELVASFDAEDRAARAHLDAVRRGGPLFPMDEAWLTPDGTRAADEALAAWRSATDRRRARAQRECAKVLRAVAALARSGQLDRARELFARLELADDRRSGADGPLVAAWVAMGELDRAVAHAAETPWLALEAVTPLVVGLSAAGRRSEALAILGPALERVDDRAGLRELAPAVLALADDPREQAEAMLASWTRADVERSRLEC